MRVTQALNVSRTCFLWWFPGKVNAKCQCLHSVRGDGSSGVPSADKSPVIFGMVSGVVQTERMNSDTISNEPAD